MRALAVDTSTSMAGIAVVDEQQGLLAEYMLNDKKTHSQKLVPMLKEVLDSLKMSISDMDILAAVTGPGSFTGLRIGVTTIKSMAYAAQKPTAGIPSLDALASAVAAPGGTMVCPMLDARNNQVYTALYRFRSGRMENTSGYMGLHINELVSRIEDRNAHILFTGDAVSLHRDFLKIQLGERCSFAPDFLTQHMAASAAHLALLQLQRGETVGCFDLKPFYLRQSQAEREYGKKQAEEIGEDRTGGQPQGTAGHGTACDPACAGTGAETT
jgi:tRNA threonylcarbamoyladenosine biosynthesis protein TsaB